MTLSGSQLLKKGQTGGPHCPDIKRVRKELRKKNIYKKSQVGCTPQSQNNPPPHYSNCGTTRNIQNVAQVPRVNVLKIECQMAFATLYTEYPRRNRQNFGRVFLMLKYTDITQNTYVQS